MVSHFKVSNIKKKFCC